MAVQPIRRFLLKVGYACNNHCLFCHSAPHSGMDATTEASVKKIEMAKTMGAEHIVLSGGEPTIYKDLPLLVRRVRRLSLGLGMVTNGRMLLYENLTEFLLDSGLDYVQLSLAAGRAQVHDAIVGVEGAFEQANRGLEQLLAKAREPLDLTISCVMTAPALTTLDQLADLALRSAKQAGRDHRIRLKLSVLELEGRALQHAGRLNPGLGPAAQALDAFAERRRAALEQAGVSLVQEGMPPCLSSLPRADLWTDGFIAMSEAFESRWHPVDDANRQRAPTCIDCSQDGCPGPYATTLEQDDPALLVPLRSRRPSSVPFRPLKTVFVRGHSRSESCPIRENRIPPGPAWSLWTRRDLGASWAWTVWNPVSRDFGPREYQHFVSDLAQVYGKSPQTKKHLPPEASARRGPFADLVKFARSSLCRDCPRRLACLGLFEPTHPARCDAVERDANLLAERLGSITGNVLDVGSGFEPPYSSAFVENIRRGSLHYLAVDPDLSPEQTEASVQFIQGRAEQLEDAVEHLGRPDWILSIRALPHYEHPSRFLKQARRLLAPGGRIFVVSDEPFAVLVDDQPKQAVEQDWQHWRNPRFSFLLQALKAWKYEIEWTRPAESDTSNLNFLVARRPPSKNSRKEPDNGG